MIINPYRFGGAASSLLTNLVSWWSLDETSGTRYDSHGSNDLTDNATVTYAAGKQGNAAEFVNANAEYLDRATTAALKGPAAGDFTIALWVYLGTAADLRGIIDYGYGASAGQYNYRLRRRGASGVGYLSWLVPNSGSEVKADTTDPVFLTESSWYFVIADYDSTADLIGISLNNGTRDTASVTTPNDVGSSPTFRIGAEKFAGRSWDGLIDEVAYWSRLLTTDEKTSLYNSGSGIAYPG